MAAHIKQLSDYSESDAPGELSINSRWVVVGHTKQDLYDLAAPIIGAGVLPITSYRTAYLAKVALINVVPITIGPASLTRAETISVDEVDNHFEFEVEHARGANSSPSQNLLTTAPGSTDPNASPPLPSVRLATETVLEKTPRGEVTCFERNDIPTFGTQAIPKVISPDASGESKGLNVVRGVLRWNEPHLLAADDQFLQKIDQLKTTINANAFRGFAAGDVLLLGVAADLRADGRWDANFEFQHKKGYNDEKYPGFEDFKNVTARGWDFIDPVIDADTKIPIALCVYPVYDELDWSTIVPSLGEITSP